MARHRPRYYYKEPRPIVRLTPEERRQAMLDKDKDRAEQRKIRRIHSVAPRLVREARKRALQSRFGNYSLSEITRRLGFEVNKSDVNLRNQLEIAVDSTMLRLPPGVQVTIRYDDPSKPLASESGEVQRLFAIVN